MRKYFFITETKEPKPQHKGRRITVTDTSGMKWFTWKGIKHFLHEELFIYSVQREMQKGRSKEEVFDEMWDIFAQIPYEKA